MIKVAFIDDGILPIFEGICLSHYVINQNMVVPCFPMNLKYSHATTCTAIFIQTLGLLIKDVEIISICILNNEGSGALKDLNTAIIWAYENDVKIISLSLGGTHFFQQKMLVDCINSAANKDVIIVAAQSNDNVFTYPASFSNVIGVKSFPTYTAKNISLNTSFPFDGIEFCANSVFHLPIYSKSGHRTRASNSFATPVISALVAKLCLCHIDLNVFDAKCMLCEQYSLCSDYIRPTSFDWSNKSILICFNRCNINYRYIQNTSIVNTYDFSTDIPIGFPDMVISKQENTNCDTLIIYGRNDSDDIYRKLSFLFKYFRYTLFIESNEAYNKNEFYSPLNSNILGLKVINNSILFKELDSQSDIPIIRCLISLKQELFFYHLEVMFDIVTAFKKKGYNCTVLTDVDFGLLYDFIVCKNNINWAIINNLIKYRNIDLLLIAICNKNFAIKSFAFDLTFNFTQNNFDADKYIKLIENTFEEES